MFQIIIATKKDLWYHILAAKFKHALKPYVTRNKQELGPKKNAKNDLKVLRRFSATLFTDSCFNDFKLRAKNPKKKKLDTALGARILGASPSQLLFLASWNTFNYKIIALFRISERNDSTELNVHSRHLVPCALRM